MSFIHQANINNVQYDIIGSCYYGTSETDAETAAKVATISNANGFVLAPGVQVAIKFTNANIASFPTLNINNTGAEAMKFKGAAATSSIYHWKANQVISFIYDGEFWQTIGLIGQNTEGINYTIETYENGVYSGDSEVVASEGAEIFNDYEVNIATGQYSHAEGGANIATGHFSHAEGRNTVAQGSASHTEGQYTIAEGEASHAEGANTVASGLTSHAEGTGTTASKYGSHAEGVNTTASGQCSHAEGAVTVASGTQSHAEGGSTTASGGWSHAEGNGTTASGGESHAEGSSTTASGHFSHAEGDHTIASGAWSHAEGAYAYATSDYQHVQGLSNIWDDTNTYLHIVGNGDVNGVDRSNAHTIDWDGNAWFSGDVYVGSTSGTNKDEGSKKYAGGTQVTLNGASKAGSTASFYAPTSAGTNKYVLVSNGSGAPSWKAASTLNTGDTAVTLNGTSKANSTASFYAPTTAGTKDYILVSNGSGAPVWAAASTLKTGSTPQKITLVATAGQTAFTIPFEYDSLSSNLTVYFNGILMKETDNYTVNTTNNTVNLAGFSAEAGDIVTIMGLLGAQSIDFGQEAIDAINDINAAVAAAKEELQDAVDQASTDINNLIKQLPSNWDDYLNKNANNVMNSGSKITMASNYTPSGNYDVTTKTYVDSAISTATSNIVTDVFYMGNTEDNTKKKLLWIDTSSENGNGIIKYHNGSAWIAISSPYT